MAKQNRTWSLILGKGILDAAQAGSGGGRSDEIPGYKQEETKFRDTVGYAVDRQFRFDARGVQLLSPRCVRTSWDALWSVLCAGGNF